MNKWINQAIVRDQALRRLDQFEQTFKLTTVNAHDTIDRPATRATVQDYNLTMTMTVNFSCRAEFKEDGARDAKRAMIANIYGDLFNHISAMQRAITAGDREACYRICDQIRNEVALS